VQGLLRNRLLQAIPSEEFARFLQPVLKPASLNLRQRLQSTNRRIEQVYFFESGVASLMAIGAERRQAEVAIIGREGMTGCSLLLGVDRSHCDIVVQVEGEGHMISVEDLRQVLATAPGAVACMQRYVHALAVQTAHCGLASAHGKIEERLARWLLMVHDRMDGHAMSITHENMALMLGVRRAGVTIAIQQFEAKGLVKAERGLVRILDRAGLETCANGFYGLPEAEIERLFPCPTGGT
jgi:CRP-like cAMP-binding protein